MNTHIIIPFDGKSWLPAQLHKGKGPPLDRVRELRRGRWTRTSGRLRDDGVEAFWNSGTGCRVLVMPEAKAVEISREGSK